MDEVNPKAQKQQNKTKGKLMIKKRKDKVKVMKPDLKVVVSNNPTPSLENCSQVFTDPEKKIFIKNLFGGSTTKKKQD